MKGKILVAGLILVLVISSLMMACAKPAPAPSPAPAPKPAPAPAPAPAPKPEKEWNLKAEYYGPPKGISPEAIKWMFDEIGRRSDGRVKIELFYGTLGKTADAMANAGTGGIDIAYAMATFTTAQNPYYSSTSLPGAGSNPWAIVKGMQQMMREGRIMAELEAQNVVPLNMGRTPGSSMIVVKKTITKGKLFDDIKGLRMRAPSAIHGRLLGEMGTVPVQMGGREVYDALDKGVVDGAYSGIRAVLMVKWYEATKSLVLLGTESAANAIFVINKDLWNSFSPATRAIFDEVANEYTDKEVQGTLAAESGWLNELKTKHGMQIYRPTAEEQAKLNAAAAKARQGWFDEWDAKGFQTEKWFNDYLKVVKKYEKEYAEKGYPWQR